MSLHPVVVQRHIHGCCWNTPRLSVKWNTLGLSFYVGKKKCPNIQVRGFTKHRYNWPNVAFDHYAADAPVRKNLTPDDWNTASHYPVAVRFFMDFENQDFWDHHVKREESQTAIDETTLNELCRYHATSTHMPKIIGFLQNISPNEVWTPPKFQWKFDPEDFATAEITLDNTMTKQEILAIQIENRRKRQANRISKRIQDNPIDRSNIKVPTASGSSKDDDDHVDPPELEQEKFPRYDEIKEYLIQNRALLALDTMKSSIPEHTMLRHLRKTGLPISPQEWRDFLAVDAGDSEGFFMLVL